MIKPPSSTDEGGFFFWKILLNENWRNALGYTQWLSSEMWQAALKYQHAGSKDAAALSMVGGSLAATSPALALAGAGLIGATAPLALAAAGGYALGARLTDDLQQKQFLKSALNIRSAPVPTLNPHDGLLVGYTCDGGLPVRIPDFALLRHFMVGGMTGIGKTVSSITMIAQQISRGGGVLWIDGKLDPENIQKLAHLTKWCGREGDLRIINPGDPKKSNSYNFVLDGDPDEVASRILSTIPSTEGSSGADYYKQAANHGLTCLVATLKGLGLAYNCMDLSILLSNDKALIDLDGMVDADASLNPKTRSLFKLFLESVKTRDNKTGAVFVDLKKMRDVFGGIAGRLFVYGVDKMGEITSSYNPDVRLFEDIRDGRVIYCALPTMGKLIAAQNFGKAMLGDLRSAVARVQSLVPSQRPNPPFMVWMDEVQSYGSAQALATQFQQNRSANIFLGVGYQDSDSIEVLGEAFLETMTANTYSKLFFNPNSQVTAEAWADLIGKHKALQLSVSNTYGAGSSAAALRVTPDSMRSSNVGVSVGQREVEEYRVAGEDLMKLDFGQALLLYGSARIYDIRVPKLELDPNVARALGDVSIQRPRRATRKVRGLNLFERYADFISKLDESHEVQRARKEDQETRVRNRFSA